MHSQYNYNISVLQSNSKPHIFSSILEPLNYHVQSEKELKEFPNSSKVSICLKGEQYKNGFEQNTIAVQKLKDALFKFGNAVDCYITSNQFYYGRSEAKLCNLVMFSCDLDTYKTDKYKNTTHDELIRDVKAVCIANNLPFPTIIMYSGNGYYLKWIFTEKVRVFQAPKIQKSTSTTTKKWKIAQRVINKLFEEFGSDTKALDVARLLRLCGTINSKTGKRAELLETHDKHSFDYMLDVLKAHTTQEDQDGVLPKQKKVKAPQIKAEKVKSDNKSLIAINDVERHDANPNFIAKNTRSLAKARYDDLLKLIEIRGDIVGERMSFLFWLCNFQSITGKMNYLEFEQQATKLGNKIFKDTDWRFADLSTLEDKLKEYNLKTTTKICNKSYIPLYTPKNDTLISIFNISEDEQKSLKTIISADEKRRRNKDRKTVMRRSLGMKEQEGDKEKKPWISLGVGRTKYYEMKKNGLI